MKVWTEMAEEIKKILDGAGFTAMGEYTSADSLLHSGEAIGFYGLKGYDVVDEVIWQGGKSFTLSIYVISTCGSWARQENTMTWRSFRKSVKALWRSLQKAMF